MVDVEPWREKEGLVNAKEKVKTFQTVVSNSELYAKLKSSVNESEMVIDVDDPQYLSVEQLCQRLKEPKEDS